MRLKPGDNAVPFSVETIEGKRIYLELFAGKPLLLMFYRYASCPMCNLRLRDFAQHYPRLRQRGLKLLLSSILASNIREMQENRIILSSVIHSSTCTTATVWRLHGLGSRFHAI
jgi:peroxiredoxin